MSKKTDRGGRRRHPGETYREFKRMGHTNADWVKIQKEFKRKKRLRRISRLTRRGQRHRHTMRPRPV